MLFLEAGVRIAIILLVAIGTYVVRKYSLQKWVTYAVKAAEMIYNGEGMGEEKFAWVVNYMRTNFKWFTLTDEQLKVLIEAAVEELQKTGS